MEENETSLGKEVAKAFTVSAAAAAGTVVGMIAIGYVVGKVQEFKARKAAEKEEE